MAIAVSLKGIDEAISNLNYKNPEALKSRLVDVMRGYYQDESSIESLHKLDAVELIKVLWDTGDDDDLIKDKRKNLSSTKSGVNSDLKKLFKEGKNSEGVMIGRNNVFEMSDQAKDQILSALGASAKGGTGATLRHISEVLRNVQDILSEAESVLGTQGSDGLNKLEELRSVIQGLAEEVETAEGAEDGEEAEVVEEVLTGEDEEIEEVEETDEDEFVDVLEELDDEEGGSSPHTIPDDTTIKSAEYLAFYRGDTKLSLNNSDESVRILHPDGEVTDSVTYEGKAEDGQAYARDEQGEWAWTTSPTPGAANQIDQPDSESEGEDDSSTSTDSTESDTQSKDSTPTQKSDKDEESTEVKTLTIKQAKTKAKNTEVVVAGVVTVPPKILSETYLYIQDKTGGIQIYFSKKDFPALKLGDQVKVSGKISEKSGEKKINIAEQKDVSVTGAGDSPQPAFLSTGGVKDQFVGQLVKVTGQLTKSSGTTFYINDGSGEIKISLQKSAGLKKPEWKKEDWVTITGIVGKTSSGLRVLPRYQEDLQTGKAAAGEGGKIPAAGAGMLSGLLLSLFLAAVGLSSRLRIFILDIIWHGCKISGLTL